MERVYLSRRNLLSLLAKLDRNKSGEGGSACTLIKYDNQHEHYPQTMEAIMVTALEDEEYYNRPAGAVHHADEPDGSHLEHGTVYRC